MGTWKQENILLFSLEKHRRSMATQLSMSSISFSLINELVARNIRVIILKQNLDISQHDMNSKIVITLFSLFAELERDLVSLRTKEALAAKKGQGVTLGKPKGIIQKSKRAGPCPRANESASTGSAGLESPV
jgi:DNA invertase Pin-like site-specific DNA recombinase